MMCLSQDFQKEVCIYQTELGSVKAVNPLHAACLLLINKTAKEKEKKPNTVSKDKGHVGAHKWLCYSNLFCPYFQVGRQNILHC